MLPTRFMLECAPAGKFAGVIYDFAFKRHLPLGFAIWALLSIPIAFTLVGCMMFIPVVGGTDPCASVLLLLAFLLPMLFVLIKMLSRPTHLCVTQEGVSYCWRRTLSFYGRTLRWGDLERIAVLQPQNTSRAQSRLLCFHGGGQKIELRVDEVTDPYLLPVLFEAIQEHAALVPRDPDLQTMLGLERSSSSYTELWLKALTAPPERNRLVPLSEGTCLQGGEYRIIERIGAGGQGTAYAALRRSDEIMVVLKEYVLPVGVSYGSKIESLEKFQKEAQILGQIDHPKIVKLLDFFFEDHRGYMVLEFIEGCTLQSRVSKFGPFGEKMVIDLALQMTEILSYLHSRQPAVIHRDFTPDNLMLTSQGNLKLIDFNVAQQKKSIATATVVGKHAYIAPDQFRGRITPQNDLYSLGACLYFLLTGCEPKPISVAHPRHKNSSISNRLDDIVANCTALEANARYETAEMLIGALIDLQASGF